LGARGWSAGPEQSMNVFCVFVKAECEK